MELPRESIVATPKHLEALGLSVEVLKDLYRRMMVIRAFEDAVYDVYSRGVMPGLAHLYTGEEAVAVGICAVLGEHDNITSTHRGHGHLLAKGGDPQRMFAEILGRASGYNQGKGGSMHIVDMSLGILGANGIVGGGLGIATGAALSACRLGDGRISVAFFGDGALNEGIFYEVANMASLWKLPVVYVMENNHYGEYTSTERSTAGTGPARAEALNIPARSVDGNDVIAVYGAGLWAAERARNGEGPSFIECKTYRLRGHHMGDQGDTYGYRAQREVDDWKERCPILRFGDFLTAAGFVDRSWLAEADHDVQMMIQGALESANAAPFPDPSEVYTDVYA